VAFLLTFLGAAGFAIFLFGLQTVFLLPLAVAHEFWKRRFFLRHGERHTPLVSVIVPAFNEERTIAAAVDSILASDYPSFEVIVVDDGSTDRTGTLLAPLGESGRITLLKKTNGGKASALNAGIAVARGDVVFCTDADSMFRPETIRKIARWFVDPGIHAVCGNDTPIDPRGPLRKVLAVTTHIGTGFVRRALSILRVIPVISGNACAVRKDYLRIVGGFTDIWGEDLDLTFKLHRAGARIVYDSDSLVMCESPGTLGALWKQRVRWTRSYLKITGLHRDLMFRRDRFPFSWYLPLNWFNLIGIPVLQILSLSGALLTVHGGSPHFMGVMEAVAYVGFGIFIVVAVVSVLLDRAPRHLWYVALWGWLVVPLSYFYDAVVLTSIYSELRGASERWVKAERRQAGPVRVARVRFLSLGRELALPAAAVIVLGAVILSRTAGQAPAAIIPVSPGQPSVVVATHFDAWANPPDAITSVFAREHSEVVTGVAVGAGRWEWNFFRWRDHEATWSNDQRISGGDLLADAVGRVTRTGRGVISIVDFYAPSYLGLHPGEAARDIDGVPSGEQVCFVELVHGAYGKLLKSMVSYIARSYDVDGISLTELGYGRYCYDNRCLDSYRRATGNADWPRGFFSGRIDRNDPSIGRWRSREMSSFLRELADSAHAYGKKIYVDVPIDFDNLGDEGLPSGLHYPELAAFVDGLVVWDYFYLEGRPPSTSETVAKFFVDRYGADRTFLSIGLWGKERPLSPVELSESLSYARRGGARKFWITPNHLLTSDHWRAVVSILGNQENRAKI
jgi:biofilm PGA synthesis N-glycosyltransferase PgaC